MHDPPPSLQKLTVLSTGQSCSITIGGRPRHDPPLRVAVQGVRSSDTDLRAETQEAPRVKSLPGPLSARSLFTRSCSCHPTPQAAVFGRRLQGRGRAEALLQPGQHVGRAGDSFQRRVDDEKDEDGRGGAERDPEQREEVSVHVRYLLGGRAPFGGYGSSPKGYGSAALQAIGRRAIRVRRKANSRRPWPGSMIGRAVCSSRDGLASVP